MLTSSKFNYWQYNGVAPWIDVVRWCKEHIGGRFWTNQCDTIYFANDDAYTWFLLRWAHES